MGTPRLKLLLIGIGTTLFLLGLSPAGASSANISHSYSSNTTIASGSLVSLDPAQTSFVVLANTDNGQHLLGVAVAENDSLLAVDETADGVQVATSGTVSALVSNLNGDIEVGDQVGVSPFNGIGAKAAAGTRIIGLAQTDFNSGTTGTRQQTISDKQGHSRSLRLGYVRVNIGVGTTPAANRAAGEKQSSGLQTIGRNLTGHAVSTSRMIASLAIALITLVAMGTLIYATIFSGIISVGRNPLAKYAIFRTVGSVLAMALLLGTVASMTIFLLLH